ARTLVTAEDPAGLAKRIVEEGLSVRQAEALAQMPAGTPSNAAKPAAPAAEKDADTLALEKLLTDTTGMIVTVDHKGKGGVLRVAYRSLEQLDELCRRLKQD
ncbi:MAG: chromosome partitioning protein ParB, partial [Mesorhizobium sp.]